MTRRRALWVSLVVLAVGVSAAGLVFRPTEGDALGESWVYGRLWAPCCWQQTLDVHDSPISSQLRAEIAERVHRGEPVVAIEESLVERYGERMRAVPKGQDPRSRMPVVVALGTLGGALLVAWFAGHMGRKRGVHLVTPSEAKAAEVSNRVLDEELDAFDETAHGPV